MNASTPQFNIVSFFLIGIAVFVVVSVITLFFYFFGGRDPLRWNAEARVEAAQNPANLLQLDNLYRNQRRMLGLILWGALAFGLYIVAPEQSRAVVEALVALLRTVFTTVVDSINAMRASQGA